MMAMSLQGRGVVFIVPLIRVRVGLRSILALRVHMSVVLQQVIALFLLGLFLVVSSYPLIMVRAGLRPILAYLIILGSSHLMSAAVMFFAATDEGVYLSMNRGTSWASFNIGLADKHVRSLAVGDKNIFAVSHSGVFLYTNSATNWALALAQDSTINTIKSK